MFGEYDTAQICLNGHIINSSFHERPHHNKDYCDKCGESTITKCPKCQNDIKGNFKGPVIDVPLFAYPSFCHKCGNSFPWTERQMEAVKELAEEFDELTPEDRKKLQENLGDLVRETPKTQIAQRRYKKIMGKLGRDSYEAFKSILINIVSEAVKKTIF
jgi:hypothetical protein